MKLFRIKLFFHNTKYPSLSIDFYRYTEPDEILIEKMLQEHLDFQPIKIKENFYTWNIGEWNWELECWDWKYNYMSMIV